jgi:hypothetical protein
MRGYAALAPVDYDLSEPWRRQPFDTDQSYAIFQDFLALSYPRKTRSLPLKIRSIAETWRVIHGWDVRAARYDAHMAGVRQAAVERVTESLAERHARLGFEVTTLAAGQLARLRKAADALADDLPRLQDGQILRYLETGIRIEREAAGQAQAPAEALDLGALTVDELRQWQVLAAKATKR